MSLGGPGSLLIASFDLSVVRSIRAGLQANLAAQGGVVGPLGTVTLPRPISTGATIEPEPEFLPREVHEPEPRFLPRPEITPAPRIGVREDGEPLTPEKPTRLVLPLLPPWKQMPPVEGPTPAADVIVVKYQVAKVDLSRGSILDLFV